jgi:hypothetical protein
MKLLFICGSAEIGRDGVGDYTRRLGEELVNQGHQVKILAINDNVSAVREEVITTKEDQDIVVLRYPSSTTYSDRCYKLDRLLNEYRPDFISLQYVPYSFQAKGIPYEFIKCLDQINKKWNWHIMFHETWLGLSSLSPLKHKIVGFFQRKAAQWMVKSLKPQVITTSNRLYQMVLGAAHINASLLPLFSNIPVFTTGSTFQDKLSDKLGLNATNRAEFSILGIFGSLHKEYDFHTVLQEALAKATAANKKLIFVSFGRMRELEEFNRLKALFKSKINFVLLGELPEAEVSTTMRVLDEAISCTPMEHIGKSGVYAALRLHNVKVLLPFSDKIPELEGEIKQYNIYLHSKPPYEWAVDYVALEFVKFLNKI